MPNDFDSRVAGLSDKKRQLLELMRRAPKAAQADLPLAARDPAAQRIPLTVAQEQLWFLAELAPDQPTYNIVAASRLTGELDRPALRRAVDDLVARHEALRTVFGTHDGVPYQMVRPARPATLVVDDLAAVPRAERVAAGVRLLQEQEVHRPFDLRRGPLFRARLVRLDATDHL